VFLYTDGLSETNNDTGEEYGSTRVERSLDGLRGQPARAVVDSVLANARAFQDGSPQVDDVTAMPIRWRG